MKLLDFFKFKRNDQKEKLGPFSDFFLHASEKKKEQVLKEAARRANEEQRETFLKSQFKVKISQ